MNWDTVNGNWKQYGGKLTDDQINVIGSQCGQLVGRIRQACGISKEEAEQQTQSAENHSIN